MKEWVETIRTVHLALVALSSIVSVVVFERWNRLPFDTAAGEIASFRMLVDHLRATTTPADDAISRGEPELQAFDHSDVAKVLDTQFAALGVRYSDIRMSALVGMSSPRIDVLPDEARPLTAWRGWLDAELFFSYFAPDPSSLRKLTDQVKRSQELSEVELQWFDVQSQTAATSPLQAIVKATIKNLPVDLGLVEGEHRVLKLQAPRRRDMQRQAVSLGQPPLPAVGLGPSSERLWGRIAGMSLKEAENWLREQDARSRAGVQVLGVQVPGSIALVALPVAVMLVSIYLFVHLQEFRLIVARRSIETPAIPWVGIARGRAGKSLSLATVVVLPAVCTALLAVVANGWSGERYIAIGCALGTGWLGWRNWNEINMLGDSFLPRSSPQTKEVP